MVDQDRPVPETFIDICKHPDCFSRPLSPGERLTGRSKPRGEDIARNLATTCGADPDSFIEGVRSGDEVPYTFDNQVIGIAGRPCLGQCRLAPAFRVTTQEKVVTFQARSVEDVVNHLLES